MGSEMPLAHRDILWGTNKPQQKKGQTGERSCLPLPVTVLHLKSSLWFASGPRLRVNTWTQATKSHAQRHSNIPSAVGAGVPGSRAEDLESTSVRKSRWQGAPAVSPSFPQPYTYGLAAISLWPVSRGGRRSSRPGFWLSSYCTQALCEVNDNYIPLRHGPEWQWWRKTFPMGQTPGQTTGLSTLCGMKGDLWYGSTLTHGQWLMGWLTGQGLSKYKTGKLVTRSFWGINPHTYGRLTYDKEGKNIQWRKDSFLSKWCWASWTVGCKSVKLEHCLTLYINTDSKWLKDLWHDTIKLLEENISKTFSDISHTSVFLSQSPKAIEIIGKINRWDLIKLISFCTTEKTINEMKRQPTELEKIFASDATDQGLIAKIYKYLIQLSNKTTKNYIQSPGINHHGKEYKRKNVYTHTHTHIYV